MAKNILIFFVFAFVQQTFIAQETCESPEDNIMDMNSITKCTVEKSSDNPSKKAKTVSIQVTSRRRVVRKRNAVTGLSGNASAKKITSIKEKAALVGSLNLDNESILENVPFTLVEEIPLFKGCTKVSIAEQGKCFKEEVIKHIRKNFRYPEDAYEDNIQGRVFAQFIIDKDGSVTDLNIRGPYKGDLLEAEAKRIIKKLPQFTPGKHNGKPVKVKYGIPITFKIPGKKPSNIKPPRKIIELLDVVGFADVDQVPSFDNCKGSSDDLYDCFNREIINHVNKHFAYPQIAVDRNIEGKIYASFVVDKNGNVINVTAKGPDGTEVLENAAIRLFERLPQFKLPAIKSNAPVNVKYTFPIDFALN